MKYVTEKTLEIISEVGKLEMMNIDNLEGTKSELDKLGYDSFVDDSTDYLVCSKRIQKLSLNNGNSYVDDLEEHEERINELWEVISELMDDETREMVHNELAPCTNLEFLTRYLELATCDLIIG
jgi:protein subunit release factor A